MIFNTVEFLDSANKPSRFRSRCGPCGPDARPRGAQVGSTFVDAGSRRGRWTSQGAVHPAHYRNNPQA